ncbi:MAG: hypothetical protein AB4290_29685 [Spirulina sp.]
MSDAIVLILRVRTFVLQGKDISVVASELLTKVLEWEAWDLEDAIAGIQRGLDDFEAGRFRSFEEFVREQYHKHNLSSPE